MLLHFSVSIGRFNDEYCHFPFVYRNKSYYTCTDIDWGSFWCSGSSVFDGDDTLRMECEGNRSGAQEVPRAPPPQHNHLSTVSTVFFDVDSEFSKKHGRNRRQMVVLGGGGAGDLFGSRSNPLQCKETGIFSKRFTSEQFHMIVCLLTSTFF